MFLLSSMRHVGSLFLTAALLLAAGYAGAKYQELQQEGTNPFSLAAVRRVVSHEVPEDVRAAVQAILGRAVAEASPTPDPPPSMMLCLAVDDTISNDRPNEDGPASDPGPLRLRAEMVRLAIGLAGADVGSAQDALGFVVFRGGRTEELALVPVTAVTGEDARRFLNDSLSQVGLGKGSGWTRWDVALTACQRLLEEADHANSISPFHPPLTAVAVVLVTDGRPEDSDPTFDGDAQMTVLRQTILPEFARRGWPVYAVGYGAGGQADTRYAGYLRDVAGVTGGSFFAAARPDDLLPIMINIVAQVAGRALVKGDVTPVVNEKIVEVPVGPNVATLTINIIRSNNGVSVSVLRPDGTQVSPTAPGVTVTASQLFENWTISDPQAGTWRVHLRGDGQVYVNRLVRERPRPTPTPPPEPSPSPTAPAPAVPSPDSNLDGDTGSGSFPWLPLIGGVGFGGGGLLALTLLVWHQPRPRGWFVDAATGRIASLRQLAAHGLRGFWPSRLRLEGVVSAMGLEQPAEGFVLLFDRAGEARLEVPGRSGNPWLTLNGTPVSAGRGAYPLEDGDALEVIDGGAVKGRFSYYLSLSDLDLIGPVSIELIFDRPREMPARPPLSADEPEEAHQVLPLAPDGDVHLEPASRREVVVEFGE